MKAINNLLAASLLALAAGGALAHTDEYLDTLQTANGGQLRMAGAYHFELVVSKDSAEAKENPLVIFVTDHGGNKVSTEGASGTVVLLGDKRKTNVVLAPDGDNRLKGSGQYASTPDLKVVATITMAGQAPEQARFTPLAPRPAGMEGMKHAQ